MSGLAHVDLFFWVIMSLAYLVIVGLLWANNLAQEKRSLWSERPFEVSAYSDEGERLHFGHDFYVNQVNVESNDINFSLIKKDGRLQTLTELPYIATEAELKPTSDTRPDLIGLSVSELQKLLENSPVETALLFSMNDKVVEMFVVDKSKVQILNRERRRIFVNRSGDIVDSRGFDLFVYKNGKMKNYSMERY